MSEPRSPTRSASRAIGYFLARLRGEFYRAFLPLIGRRFRAGSGLQVRGRLLVRGPGNVEFGDRVQIWGTVTPFTHAVHATIRVGNGSVLAGTRFGCAQEITVGDDCIVADCRIMDTDFHPLSADRRNPAAEVRTAPVCIEDNVWLAAQTGVLPGTVIGRNSVAAFGAVCSGKYPSDVVLVGNPARVAARIPGAPVSPA